MTNLRRKAATVSWNRRLSSHDEGYLCRTFRKGENDVSQSNTYTTHDFWSNVAENMNGRWSASYRAEHSDGIGIAFVERMVAQHFILNRDARDVSVTTCEQGRTLHVSSNMAR